MVLFFYISIYVSSQRRSSVRKGIFKNFAKFTGKQQFWSLFFINLQAMFSYEIMKFLRTPILKNIWTIASEFIRDTTLLHETILKKHTNRKTNFQDGKEYNQEQYFEWLIKTNDLKFISTDILVSLLRPFSL